METTLDISLNSQDEILFSVSANITVSSVIETGMHRTLMANVNPTVQMTNGNIERRFIARVRPIVEIEIEVDEFGDDEIKDSMKEAEAEVVTQFPGWVRSDYVNRVKRFRCFELIREMILNAIPDVEIARKVQQMGEGTNLKLETLKSYILHYRCTIPAFVLASRQQPKQFLEVKQRVENQIDIMEKLANLYEMVERRLENSMANDEKFGIITMGIERSFIIAKDLLMTIQMMREKLGIGPGQDKRGASPINSENIDWSKIYARESVAKVMNNPESRSRVVRVAERLIDLYGKQLSPQQMATLMDARDLGPTHQEVVDEEDYAAQAAQEVTIESL